MSATRESAIAALQTALTPAAAFGKVTRRLLSEEQMCAVGSPGLALVVHHEDYHRPALNQPPRRTLTVLAVVYVMAAAADPNAVPDSLLNPILDGFDAALAPDNPITGLCTLGGLVYGAAIRGQVERAPGDKTGRGVAIVPIDLVLP